MPKGYLILKKNPGAATLISFEIHVVMFAEAAKARDILAAKGPYGCQFEILGPVHDSFIEKHGLQAEEIKNLDEL